MKKDNPSTAIYLQAVESAFQFTEAALRRWAIRVEQVSWQAIRGWYHQQQQPQKIQSVEPETCSARGGADDPKQSKKKLRSNIRCKMSSSIGNLLPTESRNAGCHSPNGSRDFRRESRYWKEYRGRILRRRVRGKGVSWMDASDVSKIPKLKDRGRRVLPNDDRRNRLLLGTRAGVAPIPVWLSRTPGGRANVVCQGLPRLPSPWG